jgi:hypothetical protein
MRTVRRAQLAVLWILLAFSFAGAEEWPQLGRNPQRWNYSPETVEPPYRVRWCVNFQDFGFDYRIYPGIQVVLADGKAFVGTKNGHFFALDAADGKVAWRVDVGWPVMQAAGCTDGKVFFGAMNGCVYALDTASGREVWKFASGRRYGFSAAVLVAEDKVLVPDRGGVLYALDQKTGRKLWQYDAGCGVLHTPAYDQGRVYFGSEDGRVHAVAAADGHRVWLGGPLLVHTFVESWPVLFDGKVVLRFHTTQKLSQTPVRHDYTGPWEKSLVILDEDTGQETLVVPQITTGMGGPTKPPAVTGDGRLVMPWQMGEGKVRGLVLMDLKKPDQVDKLLDKDKLDWPIERGFNQPPGIGSHQENLSQSVFGNVVVNVHYHGFAWGDPQTQMGAYHLVQRRWYTAGASREVPEPVGGDREHNAQGGTSAPASCAYGRMYHQHWNAVVCWEPAR